MSPSEKGRIIVGSGRRVSIKRNAKDWFRVSCLSTIDNALQHAWHATKHESISLLSSTLEAESSGESVTIGHDRGAPWKLPKSCILGRHFYCCWLAGHTLATMSTTFSDSPDIACSSHIVLEADHEDAACRLQNVNLAWRGGSGKVGQCMGGLVWGRGIKVPCMRRVEG